MSKTGGLRRMLQPWWAKLILLAALIAAAWGVYRLVNPPAPPPAPPSGKVEKADITQVVQAAGVLQAKTKSRRASCWSAWTPSWRATRWLAPRPPCCSSAPCSRPVRST